MGGENGMRKLPAVTEPMSMAKIAGETPADTHSAITGGTNSAHSAGAAGTKVWMM